MSSPVSGLLHEPLSSLAQEAIFLPWIRSSFSESLPLLTRLNRAHLVAVVDAGLVGRADACVLAEAIRQVDCEGADGIALDGALEDVYFNYEAQLIRHAGREAGARLHIGRSRNDLQAALDRLRARSLGLALALTCADLRETLLQRALPFLDCVMPGYTHMQHAQPITFGFYLLGIEQSVQRDTRRAIQALGRVNVSPLGAGALAGNAFGLDRKRTAQLLGFASPMAHTLDAVASKDALIELLVAALFAATTVGRLAQDFYNMSTYEAGMLELPDNLTITSSLMPQKKNQAVLEFVKGRQSHLLGAVVTAFTAFHAKPFTHVLDANADSLHFLWDALRGIGRLLPVVCATVAGAEPRCERMRQLADANFATATDFADCLVAQHSLAFKDAHHVTGRLVRLALEQGLKPSEVTGALAARAAQEVLGRRLELDDRTVRDALDSAASIGRRKGSGGPAREDALALMAAARDTLAADRAELAQLQKLIADADEQLERATAAFL